MRVNSQRVHQVRPPLSQQSERRRS